MDLMVAINEMKLQLRALNCEKSEVITALIQSFNSLTKYCLIFDYIPNELSGKDFVEYNGNYYFSNNKVNIIAGLRCIIDIIEEEQKKYDSQIEELQEGLEVIRGLNTVCETCNGRGKIRKPRLNSYCDIEMIPCVICQGSGKRVK